LISSTFSFPADTVAIARRAGFTPERCQRLAQDLDATMDALWRRKASEVPDGHLDAYVALRWLRWRAGALELTDAGHTIRTSVVG